MGRHLDRVEKRSALYMRCDRDGSGTVCIATLCVLVRIRICKNGIGTVSEDTELASTAAIPNWLPMCCHSSWIRRLRVRLDGKKGDCVGFLSRKV